MVLFLGRLAEIHSPVHGLPWGDECQLKLRAAVLCSSAQEMSLVIFVVLALWRLARDFWELFSPFPREHIATIDRATIHRPLPPLPPPPAHPPYPTMSLIHCTPLGFFQLFLFFAAWLGSAGLFPLAIALFYLYGVKAPAILLVAYYVYRFLFPRRPWRAAHKFNCDVCAGNSYFKTQRMVFDEAAGLGRDGVELKPGQSSLFCFHPHGILCCGWSLNGNMNGSLFKGDVHFMGTDALFQLPMVSDLLTWYNCGPAVSFGLIQLCARGGAFQSSGARCDATDESSPSSLAL